MTATVGTGNLAEAVLRHARTRPERTALVVPTQWDDETVHETERVTYAELAARVETLTSGLRAGGIGQDDRVLVAFPLGVDFYAFVLAVLAAGAAVVLVDAGMGRRRALQSVQVARPTALVAGDAVLRLRLLAAPLRRIRRVFAAPGARARGRVQPWEALATADPEPYVAATGTQDHAFVTFTSGSTGRPKGADRTHGLLFAQHEAIKAALPFRDDDVDMVPYPVLVLHDLMCGITAVLPPLDFSAGVGSIQPKAMLSFSRSVGVTQFGGSPAFLRPVLQCVLDTGSELPAVRRIGTGGGPVSVALMRDLAKAFPDAESLVLYGATEAEPIAHISVSRALAAGADETDGSGYLVGAPAPEIELALVQLDLPAGTGPQSIAAVAVPHGAWGQVAVRGPQVLTRYWAGADVDSAVRLQAGAGLPWHLTGDVARLDTEGRLWLGGRVRDAVRIGTDTVHPYTVEGPVDAVTGVVRSALVAHRGAPGGELCVQLEDPQGRVPGAVANILDARGLGSVPVVPVAHLPLDGRHNTKVDRPTLRTERERGVLADAVGARVAGAAARLLALLPERAVEAAWTAVGPRQGGAL